MITAQTVKELAGPDCQRRTPLRVQPVPSGVPTVWGRSTGRALARVIVEEARSIGYKRMRPETVMEPAKYRCRSLAFVEVPPHEEVPMEGLAFIE